MSDDHEEEQPPVPTSADAAASQKALNSINATNDDDAGGKTEVDKDAVQAAISEKKKAPVAPTATVKVDEKDVKILMSQFEFSKQKATDVLRHNKGDLKVAATAVIRGEA